MATQTWWAHKVSWVQLYKLGDYCIRVKSKCSASTCAACVLAACPLPCTHLLEYLKHLHAACVDVSGII